MRWWVGLAIVIVGLVLFGPRAVSSASPQLGAEWIVVLGAAQYNGQPSPIFRNRLEAALNLYRQKAAPKIVVTGGRKPGDNYTEGGTGCRYLMQRGVPRSALVCENSSRSTFENLNNIRSQLEGGRVIIVTDEPHLPRAMILASHLGIRATGYAVKGEFAAAYWQRENWLALLARVRVW
jgi:uncharacterized SAM-binding protein YcdF (DUF218 family)